MKENAEYGRREEVTTRQRPTVATNDILCACEAGLSSYIFPHWVKMTFTFLNSFPCSSSFS